MKLKRMAALILAIALIFSLTACGKPKRQIVKLTLSTEDSEAILAAAGITLPDAEVTAASGSTIKWFAHYDSFHNYSEDEVVNTGYFTFSEKYGCEITWVETEYGTRYDNLANLILGGTPPDFYPGNSDTFPNYAIKGVFQSVDDYIDYNDPLWEGTKAFADSYFTLSGKHYMMITDTTFDKVCAYNRRVMDEYGFEDPAELYYNNEWTWDKFAEMCIDFSDPDSDRYALDGWSWDAAFMDSSGANVVYLNTETGLFESNVDDPRLERSADVIYNLCKNSCVYPLWQRGWAIRNETEGGGIKDGLCLFWLNGEWAFKGPVQEVSSVWGDVSKGEVMFCPIPRDPAGDGNYYVEASPAGYCLVANADNPEGVALFAMCERFKKLDPTVIDIDRKQLEEIYLWTDEMLTMHDTCKKLATRSDTTILDYFGGLGDSLYEAASKFKKFARSSNVSSWSQIKENNEQKLDYYLAELNDRITQF